MVAAGPLSASFAPGCGAELGDPPTLAALMALHTPLYDRHVSAGGRMVDFAGWEMPLQYRGMREEHQAVRERAGIFDVSHMGEVLIGGAGSAEFIQGLLTNDFDRLGSDQAMYSLMLNEHGGIVDDVIANRFGGDHHLVIVNAATREKDVAWMRRHAPAGVEIHDRSEDLALLAVQGPLAIEILAPLAELDGGTPLQELRPFHHCGVSLAGITDSRVQRISRTGYTGEDGVEILIDAQRALTLWDAILEAGASRGLIPCGLGARDTLRLEAGLRLYGQDMDDQTDPYSVGLGWTVKRDKGDFVGRAAIAGIDPKQPPRRFIGLRFEGRAIARHGQRVRCGDRDAGEVTSGTFSFTLGCGIATASVDGDLGDDAEFSVDIRGTETPAQRVPLPFYRRNRNKET